MASSTRSGLELTGATANPCGKCSLCYEIAAGTSIDVLEIDGASNTGVDRVRDLRDNVRFLPAKARTKIYIIDEVHMLSTAAFNALLKTLEEPPPHVKFIFATTEPQKIPITILSRSALLILEKLGAKNSPSTLNLSLKEKALNYQIEHSQRSFVRLGVCS